MIYIEYTLDNPALLESSFKIARCKMAWAMEDFNKCSFSGVHVRFATKMTQ